MFYHRRYDFQTKVVKSDLNLNHNHIYQQSQGSGCGIDGLRVPAFSETDLRFLALRIVFGLDIFGFHSFRLTIIAGVGRRIGALFIEKGA